MKERRTRPLALGIVCAVLGVGAAVAGFAVAVGAQTAQVRNAAARTALPGTMSFDAREGDYTLILVRPLRDLVDPMTVDRVVAFVVCDVARSDGSTVSVRGSQSGSSTETDAGITIGDFAATAGPTVVDCGYLPGRNFNPHDVAVAESVGRWATVGWVLLGVGGGFGVAAFLLIRLGFSGRTRVVPAGSPDLPTA